MTSKSKLGSEEKKTPKNLWSQYTKNGPTENTQKSTSPYMKTSMILKAHSIKYRHRGITRTQLSTRSLHKQRRMGNTREFTSLFHEILI